LPPEGGLSLDQFCDVVVGRLVAHDARKELLLAFRLLDADRTGAISRHNLAQAARRLGQPLSDAQLDVGAADHP